MKKLFPTLTLLASSALISCVEYSIEKVEVIHSPNKTHTFTINEEKVYSPFEEKDVWLYLNRGKETESEHWISMLDEDEKIAISWISDQEVEISCEALATYPVETINGVKITYKK